MRRSEDPFGEVLLEPSDCLSPAGRARRGEMLRQLQTAVARQRRWRIAVRGMVWVAFLLSCLSFFLWGLHGRRETPAPTPAVAKEEVRGDLPPNLVLERVQFEVVRNRRAVVERYVASNSGVNLEEITIGDGELLSLLASGNRPVGLIRLKDRAYLSTDLAALPTKRDSTESPR